MVDFVGRDASLESIVRSYGYESCMNKRIKFESESESSDDDSDYDDNGAIIDDDNVDDEDLASYKKTVCLSRLRIGNKVDVVSLLSSKGRDFLIDKDGNEVKVSSIRGKYILIMKRSSLFHTQISSALKTCIPRWCNFQLVIIVDDPCRRCSAADELSFKSLLAGFPSCLAVPLSDSFDYSSFFTGISFHEALILDPHGSVLQLTSDVIVRYGPRSFPFTHQHASCLYEFVNHLPTDDNQPLLLLENLLNLQPVDSLFNAAADHSILVDDLKHKLVGLYLCCNGESIDVIHQTSLHCHANGLQLEVVLVYLPLYDDPSPLITRINAELRDKSISSWWLLPFDDFTSRRLWNLCEFPVTDQFIIVGPQGQFFDTKAMNVISSSSHRQAIKHMYPYAIESVAHQETHRLNNLTLPSFLLSDNHVRIHLARIGHPNPYYAHSNPYYTLSYLLNKIVCLFIFNCGVPNIDTAIDQMESWCLQNQGFDDFSKIALVLLPINASNSPDFDFTLKSDPRMSWLYDNDAMPWLICTPDAHCETSILQLATLRGLPDTLTTVRPIQFGEGGNLISLDECPFLSNIAAEGVDDDLYDQIYTAYYSSFCYDDYVIGPYY